MSNYDDTYVCLVNMIQLELQFVCKTGRMSTFAVDVEVHSGEI